MSTLRISDAPLLPDVNGTEKIPTGGRGDYAISVDQIKDHIFQDVGKELVGLGNVDNTSDLDKPVSTAQQAALNLKADKTYVDDGLALKADKTNVYTRSETTLALSQKADLVDGVVPENQIPSSFNDVLEFTTPDLPIIGESGKIYVTTDTNRTWRWSGNQYVEISNGGVSDSTLKLQTPRKIANVDFDGTQNIDIPHNNLTNRDTLNAHTADSISYGSSNVGNFLKQGLIEVFDQGYANSINGYPLNSRLQLSNGEIVRNIISGNTNNPNTNMTGWVNYTRMLLDVSSIAVNIVSPSMFGAKEGQDNAQALRDCFNYATANNALIQDFTGSVYEFNSNILITAPNKTLRMVGNCELYSLTANITFAGTIEQIGNITVAASRNALSVTLSSTVGVNSGDIIAIQNSRPYSFNKYRANYFDGEIKEVSSVTDSVINLNKPLETSYLSGIEDEVYRINPIKLDINGFKFNGSGLQSLRVSLASDSSFIFDVSNGTNLTNSSYGVIFDRVYNSKMLGGKAYKIGLGGAGTDYGISVSNCQDLEIRANYSYGHRHGVAMGGADVDGAIPCRRVIVNGTTIENQMGQGLHTADIHGNAIDCAYYKCNILGMVGLGGERCYSIQNTINLPDDEVRTPIFITEASGQVGSIGDFFPCTGGASQLMGWASSSVARLNDKPFTFILKDAVIGKTSIIGLMSALSVSTAVPKFIIDGFEFLESFSTVTRLMSYAESPASGVTAAKPSYVQITNPKNAMPDSMIIITGDGLLTGIKKRIFGWSGRNADGSFTVREDGSMTCTHRIAVTTTFNTAYQGGFKTPDQTWTYPKAFQAAPRIFPSSADGISISGKEVSSGSSSAQIFGISLISSASAGLVLNVIAEGRLLS